MRSRHELAGILGIAAFALMACGGGNSAQTSSPPTPSPTPTPVVKTASVTIAGVAKTILVDAANGLTLYVESTDAGGKIACTGACASNWPALYVPAGLTTLTGGAGVTGRLSQITDSEGKQHVTYNGWPLYHYVKDQAPGDTMGNGLANRWSVVAPDIAPTG